MTRSDVELYRVFARAAWPGGESRTLSPTQRRAVVRGIRACLEGATAEEPDVRELDRAFVRAVRQAERVIDACAAGETRANVADMRDSE